MFSWSQLQYALAVEKHRHFGKAAQSCNITQPALSQQLQKLEDELGIILFDRLKKPILPTPEGRLFLEQAQAVLREQEKLVHVAKASRSGELNGDFRLAIIPTVASELLPSFLKPFLKAHPKVRLFVEEMKTEVILNELNEDRLDGAILATPIDGVDFKIHPLYYEPFLVYFSAGHPLLQHDWIEKKWLSPNEMWLLQDGHCFKDQVLNFCALPRSLESSAGHVQFQSGSLDTLKRMVQNNFGYTFIPALMAISMRKAEREAHVRPFKAPVPTREISMIYRRDHWKLGIISALERAIAGSLPESIHRRPERTMKVLEVADS